VQPKLKTGPRWLSLAPQTYPHNLWCSFYRFPLVRLKNNLFEFWRLFGPRYHWGGKGWKSGPYDLVLHQKHTHIIRYAVFIVLRSVRLKNVSVEFWRPFGPEDHRSSQSWKSSLDDSVLTAEVYPNYLGCISCRFLFVRVETVSDKFLRLFRARARPEHEKLKPGPRLLGLAPETYLHLLGAILIISHQYCKEMLHSNFKNFFRPGHHRCNQIWIPDPDDYIWHSKHTHTICGAVSIVFR